MAEAGACATKIVGGKMVKTDSFGISLHGVPSYRGFQCIILSNSILRNSPEHHTFRHTRTTEPSINQRFTPDRHRNRSQPSSLPKHIDDHPVVFAAIVADPILSSRFRTAADHIPSSSPIIAASLLPRRVRWEIAFTRSCAWWPVSQFPILRPSRLTPSTLRIP